jgi:23S rRNA pseudouridine2605 synthase
MAARQPGFLKRGEPVRLQAFLARSGVASRRAAEEMITHGRIAVNGETVTAMGLTVVPGIDRVEVDGEEVKVAPTMWLALHKPKGYVTTRIDPYDRQTVYDLLPDKYHGLFHVGRLDRDSEGLLLLTNDGDLANRFLHPSFGITKEYDVVCTGKPTDAALRQLVEGVELEDGVAQAESAKLMGPAGNGLSRLKLVLREGKKREVRRMLAALGHDVTRLVRQRFGPIELGELPKGKYRIVQPEELSHVRTPPKKTTARETHGAYEADAEKPRAKPGAKPGAKTSAAARTRPAATTADGERRPRTKAAAEDRPAARAGARSGSRYADGDTPPKRGGTRAGTKLPSGSRFDGEEPPRKRRVGQEKRGRPVDLDAPPKRPRAAEASRGENEWDDARPSAPRARPRSDNEWDDAPAPRSRPDREYEERGPARGGRAGGPRAGGARSGGPRAGGTRSGGTRAGFAADRGARGRSPDREDRPARSGGERGARFGGDERGGSRGSRFGGEERGGSRGSRSGGDERGASRGGRFGGEERSGGSRGSRSGGDERGASRGGRFGGEEHSGGSRGSRFGGEERGGGSRGGRAGGEERGGGSRGGRFGSEERAGGSRGGRFSSEDRGGSRGVRPGPPPPVDEDRDELDEWSTAPRRPRAGATGGGARGGRPAGPRGGGGRAGGARGGGSRAGGGRPGGARGGSRPGGARDADGGAREGGPRSGGPRTGGGRPGGARGGGGRPGGAGGRSGGGGAGRGGRPGGRSGPRGGGGGRRG